MCGLFLKKNVIILWLCRLQPGPARPTRWPSVRAWRTGLQPPTSPTSLTRTRRTMTTNWHRWCGSFLANCFLTFCFFYRFFLSFIFTQFHLVKFFPNFLPFSCPAGTESWWRAAWPALMTSSSTAVTSLSWCTRTRQECGKKQHEDTIRKRGSRPLWGPGPPACFY